MTPAFQIRPAQLRDAPCIAALGLQVWLTTYATDGVSPVAANYVLNEFSVAQMTKYLEDRTCQIWVAEMKDHLVAYIKIHFDTVHAEISNEIATLYVQHHFARRGLGKALLQQARSVAEQRSGSSAVWLKVYANNTAALRFYENEGFVCEGETYFELPPGTQHKNWILCLRDPT